MSAPDIDMLPGFRRRFKIVPGPGAVSAEVEDDYHHMGVLIRHAQGVATAVEANMVRAPWTTCPGAARQLIGTFAGVALADFPARGEKQTNCTHLHDLAVLAAAHAHDCGPLNYDVLTSDPVDGLSRTELRRNGETLLRWEVSRIEIVSPPELAGTRLDKLKPATISADTATQEAVRVLRWGTIIAHGRSIPLALQSDASRFPGNCYTFQPERISQARRVGGIKDFSAGPDQPLDEPAAPTR